MIINHITYSVSDLNKSIEFYSKLFQSTPVATGENLAYFDLDGLWLALNFEDVKRTETYSHIAFFENDLTGLIKRLNDNEISYDFGRTRNEEERKSLYIRDPDGHLIEFHTKTLKNRLNYYKNNRPDINL